MPGECLITSPRSLPLELQTPILQQQTLGVVQFGWRRVGRGIRPGSDEGNSARCVNRMDGLKAERSRLNQISSDNPLAGDSAMRTITIAIAVSAQCRGSAWWVSSNAPDTGNNEAVKESRQVEDRTRAA